MLENELVENEIEEANKRGRGLWKVTRTDSGREWRIVATKQFSVGELVFASKKLRSQE